ncbi:MAG: VWA domain-containing protein [Bacteroidetes bacterium]|nr:VWA domain-containing protein [Bacteroidota bacterium]
MRILLFLFFSLFSGWQLLAQDPVIFIMDASGSMWQKIDSEFKIEMAREVLGEIVSDLPDKQAIGLVAYGHRTKGDCNDIEELLKFDNTDKAAFLKEINNLNPLGKTPLAKSAELVIENLRDSGQPATIILITDGLETCDGDLCQLVEAAKAEGIDFVLHIIGFDIAEADKSNLQCAARSADGLYVDAGDQEELSSALSQTTKLTVDKERGRLTVKCLRNGELVDCSVTIIQAETDVEIAGMRTYKDPSTNPALFHIPAGTYDVRAEIVRGSGVIPQTQKSVVVPEATGKDVIFDFSSGWLALTVTDGEELHDAAVKVIPAGEKRPVAGGRTYSAASSNPLKEELSPGLYDVEVKSTKIDGTAATVLLRSLEIKPGKTTQHLVEFEYGILRVGVTKDGVLCDATVNIIQTADGKSVAGGRTYTSSSSNPKEFILSPGTYEVSIRGVRVEGDPQETFTISIGHGDKTEKNIEW